MSRNISSYILLSYILLHCAHLACCEFAACVNNDYCNGDGVCYEDLSNRDSKFCSCGTDYYGDKCQNKVNDVFMYIVITLSILCVLFFIVMVIIAFQLNKKANEYEDLKEKINKQKKEEEKRKRQKIQDNKNNLLKKPRSRQASTSSTGSAHAQKTDVQNGFLFDITATGIERQHSTGDDKPDAVTLEMEEPDRRSRGLSLVIDVNKLQTNERKSSMSSTDGNSMLMPARVPGRPRSWAGHDSTTKGEDMDKIYKEYYGTHSDDESIDHRGYVRRSPKNSTSNLKIENLEKFDRMTKARSMTDLRFLAMQNQVPGKARSDVNVSRIRGARSVENIHTGQITILTPHPKKSPGQKRKKMGIYAKQMERMQQENPYHNK